MIQGPPSENKESYELYINKKISLILAIITVIMGFIIFGYTIFIVIVGFRYWEEILKDHFAALIGLPGAAAVSFSIVVFLRQTDGPIEFEAFGFKFKGAAGQVVMWIACFLAIAVAIRMCW